MKKVLVIYNLSSGRRRHSRLAFLIKTGLNRRDYNLEFKNYEHFLTDRHLHEHFHYDFVIVAGGDGTIRQVATFLLKNKFDIPIAIIPIGTANMLAQSLGLPRKVRQAIKLIPKSTPQRIDIGLINNEHYFLDAFCIGYVAERILGAQQSLKRHFGFMSYIFSFFLDRSLPRHSYHFTVDGEVFHHEGNSLFIVNTSRLFGLSPRRLTDLQDGKFELTVATNKNFWSFFEATFFYFFHQKPHKHLIISHGSEFIIQSQGTTYPQIDGDYFECPDGPITVKVLRHTLQVLKPHA
jgi:YegS/Rv2252/BmrU family lipid kinase